MTTDPASAAESQLQRELNYYRNECNDLGGRLLQLHEEQSRAVREARRSRTIVRLVREAYRLSDAATSPGDVSGPMLEIVVDNTLCDRAALLREEPPGSGKFLVIQSIGLSEETAEAARVLPDLPEFLYSSGATQAGCPTGELQQIIGLPFLLWAYDRMSGYALLLGNRSEANVSRPFEAGDRELIEAALSVYLDTLYRKQAEAQLRVAKRVAEEANQATSAFLDMLGRELRGSLHILATLSDKVQAEGGAAIHGAEWSRYTVTVRDTSRHLLERLDEAIENLALGLTQPALDVEWVGVDEIVRRALPIPYVVGLRKGIDLKTVLPKRRTIICVDRGRMQQVINDALLLAIKLTPTLGEILLHARRRGDGAFEVVISSNLAWTHEEYPPAGVAGDQIASLRAKASLPVARQLVEAHGGSLVIQGSPGPGVQLHLTLPANIVRDDERVLWPRDEQ